MLTFTRPVFLELLKPLLHFLKLSCSSYSWESLSFFFLHLPRLLCQILYSLVVSKKENVCFLGIKLCWIFYSQMTHFSWTFRYALCPQHTVLKVLSTRLFFASLRIHFPKGISYWKVGPDVRMAGSFHWRVNSRVIDIGKELRDHQSRIFTFWMRGTWDFKSNQEAVKSYLIADDLESRELCELVSHLANWGRERMSWGLLIYPFTSFVLISAPYWAAFQGLCFRSMHDAAFAFTEIMVLEDIEKELQIMVWWGYNKARRLWDMGRWTFILSLGMGRFQKERF